MIKYFLVLMLPVLLLSAGGPPQIFPKLSAENLDGKVIRIPEDCAGKKTLIGMAYSQKAQDALMTWYEPVYDKFIAKLGMFDDQYDVKLFFVPMFIGLKQSLYEATRKDLKESSRTDLYPYIIFYRGELEPYGTILKMDDKSLPYFYLLDEKGNIIYSTTGAFSEKKMEAIEAALDH